MAAWFATRQSLPGCFDSDLDFTCHEEQYVQCNYYGIDSIRWKVEGHTLPQNFHAFPHSWQRCSAYDFFLRGHRWCTVYGRFVVEPSSGISANRDTDLDTNLGPSHNYRTPDEDFEARSLRITANAPAPDRIRKVDLSQHRRLPGRWIPPGCTLPDYLLSIDFDPNFKRKAFNQDPRDSRRLTCL